MSARHNMCASAQLSGTLLSESSRFSFLYLCPSWICTHRTAHRISSQLDAACLLQRMLAGTSYTYAGFAVSLQGVWREIVEMVKGHSDKP